MSGCFFATLTLSTFFTGTLSSCCTDESCTSLTGFLSVQERSIIQRLNKKTRDLTFFIITCLTPFSKHYYHISHAAKITLFPLYSNLEHYKRHNSINYIWVFCTITSLIYLFYPNFLYHFHEYLLFLSSIINNKN